ncbi:BON domain protein [Methyloversatilis sp. RAC08]|uniref:BON domain-containing protein n=1 Tax=Methyloversatilis sp. RAC08 TaxID=1842540 RepID=UPI000856EF63|nr:BON domain-containing protein [Methyloversatilis sp. RAC08]AOF82897.1 BON domain protein [Methyloversatilis sp. RAC08]
MAIAAALAGLGVVSAAGCSGRGEAAIPAAPPRASAEVIDDPLVTSVRSSMRKDTEVTRQVRIALLQDAGVSRFDIDVITLTGRTSLIGVVEHRHQADRALKLASAVDGVLAVRDELSLKPD